MYHLARSGWLLSLPALLMALATGSKEVALILAVLHADDYDSNDAEDVPEVGSAVKSHKPAKSANSFLDKTLAAAKVSFLRESPLSGAHCCLSLWARMVHWTSHCLSSALSQAS